MEKTYGPLQAAVVDSLKQQDDLIAKITVSQLVDLALSKKPDTSPLVHTLHMFTTGFTSTRGLTYR